MTEIAKRYAKALFNLSPDRKEVEERLSQLKTIEHVCLNTELMRFISSPQISQEQKERLLNNQFQNRIDKQLNAFLLLILKKSRFKYLTDIIEEYNKIAMAALGIVEIDLTTAVTIDPNVKELLMKKLESIYKQKIEIREKTDPKLIGGGILTIGNRMWDFSLKNQLKRLRKNLIATNV